MTQAIPPLRYLDNTRQSGTCVCGKQIMQSGFGWVHRANAWVRLGACLNARPKARERTS